MNMRRIAGRAALLVAAAAPLAWAPPLLAQRASSVELALVGGMLIDGRGGGPIHHSVILVENERIRAIGNADSLKVPSGARVIDMRGKTVLPGLIDLHCHTDIIGAGVYDDWHPIVKQRFREIVPATEKHILMSGVTTARSPGGFLESDLFIRDSIERAVFAGPRRLVSGPYVNFGDPARGDSGPRGNPSSPNAHYLNVNTPELAREAATYLLDKSVDLIKAYNNLTEPMVRAITDEAHRRGKHVASHVAGPEDLRMRLRAGIDSVEHVGVRRSGASGPRYTQEILDLLAVSRVPVVPALSKFFSYKETEDFPERLMDPAALSLLPNEFQDFVRGSIRNFSHLRYFDGREEVGADLPRLFKQLVDAGVRILLGTEAGTPLNFHSSAAAREMVWMRRLGMAPMDVIVAATYAPAQFLRVSDNYGSVEVGKVADIIAVDGNPLFDMGVMHRVSVVVKGGVVYKGEARTGMR